VDEGIRCYGGEDFYNLLSFNGMKYRKKGSGAVITIGDVTMQK
jgi:hypothetical protein